MPDWSYQTLFRPILFKLPALIARDITLKSFDLMGRLPLGSFVIRTMGHMEMSPVLNGQIRGLNIKYPVGLSGGVDPHGDATKSLSQIGFGFIEIGPVTLNEIRYSKPILRDVNRETIINPDPYVNDGIERISERIKKKSNHPIPLMFRLCPTPGLAPQKASEEVIHMMMQLEENAAGFYLDCIDRGWSLEETIIFVESVMLVVREQLIEKSVFLYIPLDYPIENVEELCKSLDSKQHLDLDGFVVGDTLKTNAGYEVGYEGKSYSIEKVGKIKEISGDKHTIIASAGVHQPQDALDHLEAGADYVQLHSGLIYSGPGLPKRVNEAILYERLRQTESPTKSATESTPGSSFWRDWGWMCLLGVGMIIGGMLAWIIAVTTVLLPYDEAYLGMARGALEELNPRLLHFMSHDRVTLAGTMISIGIIYFFLGGFGLRNELHWSKTALMTSGIIGFSSFFLYLGYGYFDPLHASVAAILLPMFILSMRNTGDKTLKGQPNLYNDREWFLAQWGQLMFVMLGVGLAIGGITISMIGITSVFVHEDLIYLQNTADELNGMNRQLLPLIAHDRAGFGGALFSNAIALLATALWGIQQGQRWVWWMFLLGGLPGFIAGFWVHWDIDYTDIIHLIPAYFVFLLYVAGLFLLYPYLMNPPIKKADD
jgi:dihydroorotate dehydrogenase